jgi:hypothetical protein
VAPSAVGSLADLLASPTGPRTTRAAELAAGSDLRRDGESETPGHWWTGVARAIAEVLP